MTVIADSYDGEPLNSPSGVAPHPDGSIWFTDPGYGDQLAEGHPDEAGGSTHPQGILNLRIGASDAGVIGGRKRELPANTYRWDPSGKRLRGMTRCRYNAGPCRRSRLSPEVAPPPIGYRE